ncbi:uncharacterized protein LOC115008145 isoform X1 [Scomber scombrus]|uniref:Uncharacterized protein LOC115008145 isoform X1 n=1 Tax=Scomber scombrus TaxID=13677 RepID=A0AAV1N051_SCOSC
MLQNYRKSREERVSMSYHRLPTDVEQCEGRLRAIEKPNAPTSVLRNLWVCSLHFAAEDCNRGMQSEVIGGTIKKLQKTSAVLSLFGNDTGHSEGEALEKQG